MKLRILSFLLVLMLVSFPVTHVLAMSIQEDCQKTFTEDDLRIYIKNHAFAGHREHGAVVDIDRNDFYPKNECNDRNHNHKQLMKTIVVKEVWKMQYKCLDQNGDKWRIDIEGKVGRDWGVYWNDETLWKNAIPSPCATREYGHVYDLNRIDRNELLRLFNFMVSVDQYLDQTQGSKIIKGLAADFIGGASSIASALYTLANTVEESRI